MPLRLQYDRVMFTKSFHDWVAMSAEPKAHRSQHQRIAQPILTALRDELASHWVVTDPPFVFDGRRGAKLIQVAGRPGLYLIVNQEVKRTGTELVVIGGKFTHNAKGVPPFKVIQPPDTLKAEREAVQVFLRRQIESSQYEMEIEVLERVALALRQHQHLIEETDDS